MLNVHCPEVSKIIKTAPNLKSVIPAESTAQVEDLLGDNFSSIIGIRHGGAGCSCRESMVATWTVVTG